MPRPTTGKRLLIGAIVAVIVGAGALAFVWPLGEGDAPRRISIAAPGVRQPRWRITTEPAGVIHSVHRDDRRRIQRQARALTPRIRRLFNAIFLYPNQVAQVVNRFFSEEAEVSLKRSKAGLPRRVSDIKIMRRTARIGVDVSGATRAAAKVRVIAKGLLNGERFAVRQDADLWLARKARRWKVIGFQIDQAPWRRATQPDKARTGRQRRDSDPSEGGAKERSRRSDRSGRPERSAKGARSKKP